VEGAAGLLLQLLLQGAWGWAGRRAPLRAQALPSWAVPSACGPRRQGALGRATHGCAGDPSSSSSSSITPRGAVRPRFPPACGAGAAACTSRGSSGG